jgi:hypothetical protein
MSRYVTYYQKNREMIKRRRGWRRRRLVIIKKLALLSGLEYEWSFPKTAQA